MPMMSKRLDVLKALTAHIEATDVTEMAVPTVSTLAGRVFRGRTIYGAGDSLPMVSILEAMQHDDGIQASENGPLRKEEWGLLVQGWVEDDKQNPTDPAYLFVALVEKQLSRLIDIGKAGRPTYPDEYLLGKRAGEDNHRITGLRLTPPVVRPPTDGLSAKAFFYLPLIVQMAVDIREPLAAG